MRSLFRMTISLLLFLAAAIVALGLLVPSGGAVHVVVAFGIIGAILLHIVGAFWHQFTKKGQTFVRMLGRTGQVRGEAI